MKNTVPVNRLVRKSVQHSRTVTILVVVTIFCLAMMLLFAGLFAMGMSQPEPDPVEYSQDPALGPGNIILQELLESEREAAKQKRSSALALCVLEEIAFAGALTIVWIALGKKLRALRSNPEAYHVCVIRATNPKMGEDGVIRDCGMAVTPKVRFSKENIRKVKNTLLRELNYSDPYAPQDENKTVFVTVMYNTKTDRLLTFAPGDAPKQENIPGTDE